MAIDGPNHKVDFYLNNAYRGSLEFHPEAIAGDNVKFWPALKVKGENGKYNCLIALEEKDFKYAPPEGFEPFLEPKEEEIENPAVHMLLAQGETGRLIAADTFEKNIKYNWTSSNPAIATVDDTGTVTGVAPGKVLITAANPNNGVSDKIKVMVIDEGGGPQPSDPIILNDNATGTGLNQIEYTGNWRYGAKAGSYKEDETNSNAVDASFKVPFNGTSIKWYGALSNNSGKVGVYIDDTLVETVDCYRSGSRQSQQLIFDSGTLPAGPHTLRVVILDEKNAASNNRYIIVDKIEIQP